MRIAKDLKELTVDIDDVKAYEKNPRRGDIGAIAFSLQTHGQYKPIVVRKQDMTIAAGNHTWYAAKDIGAKRIAAVVRPMTRTQFLSIVAADNRTAELGGMDDSILRELLEELMGNDDMDLLMATAYDPEDLLALGVGLDHGNVTDRPTPADRLDQYQKSAVRSIILTYPTDEYEDIIVGLAELRKETGLATNAEVVSRLIRER